MLLWVCAIAAAALLLLSHLIARTSSSRRRSSSIPVVPGLPLLGNAIALGKGGLAFITQCRQQFGDVFCLRVLGQRMVFVFDPASLALFFKAPEASISFKPAVEQFTQRIYGLPSSEFFSRHEDLLATLRQLLVPDQLQELGQALLGYAQPVLDEWQQQGQVELWSACQGLVFSAAGQVLFGPAFFRRHGLQAVQDAFLEFEGNFEVAASPIPHLLLPQFRRSRAALLRMLAASLEAGDFEGTVAAQLLQGCGLPARLWPNLLLAVLWASQANSMPAMFWSLALLLLPEHAAARSRVLQELQETADSIRQQQQQQGQQQQQPSRSSASAAALDDTTAAAMLRLALDKRSWVSRCVAEAIRLRLHSIAVRYVSDDNLMLPTTQPAHTAASTTNGSSANGSTNGSQTSRASSGLNSRVQGVDKTLRHGSSDKGGQVDPGGVLHVRRGSILCICPIESHHDQRLYPDEPSAFKPDREPIQGLAPGTVVPGVAGMGFGGGFWRCPGRFFAEMELSLMLQLVLLQLHITPAQRQQQAAAAAASIPSPPAASVGGVAASCAGSRHASVVTALLPAGLMRWLQDAAVFGLGAAGGSSKQEQQWLSSGTAAAAAAAAAGGGAGSAQPPVGLPRSELRRLVGFKVPAEPWWVDVSGRAAAAAVGGARPE